MEKLKEFNEKQHILNYEKVDRLHIEFLNILNSVNLSDNDSIREKANELLKHSYKHFGEEEILMEKYNYPNFREHKDEHMKVCSELDYFIKSSTTPFGMKMLKAYYTEKLPYWFDFHLTSMDSDLVSFLSQQKEIG